MIIEQLYSQNLGDTDSDVVPVSDLVARLSNIEGSLVGWELALPQGLEIIHPEVVTREMEQDDSVSTPRRLSIKLRVVLTLRYLNVRLLLHRPVLLRKLSRQTPNGHVTNGEDVFLRHVTDNSNLICFDTAVHVIRLVHTIVRLPGFNRDLLGAWWFSLYYSM